MTQSAVKPVPVAAADLALALDEILGSLLVRSQTLLREPLTPRVAEELARIEAAGLRARAALRDAVSTERSPAPKAGRIDAGDLVSRSLAWTEPRARRAGVRITLGLADELPGLVGDPVALEHALLLVVFCSLKAAAPSGADLVVLADTVWEEDLPFVRISVADDRFSPPLGTVPDPTLPGEGLGLGVARDVVVDHGGRLEIRGRAPEGLRVTIVLPATTGPMELAD